MSSTSVVIRDYSTQIPGSIVDGKTWLFPQVNSVNSHGKATRWRICVRAFTMTPSIKLPDVPESAFMIVSADMIGNKPLPANIYAIMSVESGLVEGKVRSIVPTIITVGKNLKTVARTNTFCQALRQALGLHNKQLKKVVQASTTECTELLPPMLAQVLGPTIIVDYSQEVFVQRKYNGLRAVTTYAPGTYDSVAGESTPSNALMYSRRKNIFPGFASLKRELQPVLESYWREGRQLYLDGELYKHGAPLQEISGKARKDQDNADINYMIYDCFISNEPELDYVDRKEILDDIFAMHSGDFKLSKCVDTIKVTSRDEVDAQYTRFLDEGFEGAMLRVNVPYRYSNNDYHSRAILKIKPTQDAEFTIVGWKTGTKGKAAGALMMVCETPEPNRIWFDVTPAMESPERMALAARMSTLEVGGQTHFDAHYKGKLLVVYFSEFSADNVPQQGRTKMEVRDWD